MLSLFSRSAMVWAACAVALAAACGSSGEGGNGPGPDAGFGDGGPPCEPACTAPLVCIGGTCTVSQKCTGNDECKLDAYCKDGVCTPYGSGNGYDQACRSIAVAGAFAPKTKCEFPTAIPIPGDMFPNHVDVQPTPAVGPLGGAGSSPSIVVPFTVPVAGGYTENQGVIRILRGTDCTQEATIGGIDLDGDAVPDWARSSSTVALGDLDGDGKAEIVAFMVTGANAETIAAFTNKGAGWVPLWPGVYAKEADATTTFARAPATWAGPSLHDVDDDGKPEVMREGWVFRGTDGVLVTEAPTTYATYNQGLMTVAANVDADPAIEMTNGGRLWELDPASHAWVEDATYAAAASAPAWSAVADFDPSDGKAQPEIVAVHDSVLDVFGLDHSPFRGMVSIAVPGGGGGPPTVADYDGDGLPEIGIAGQSFYTVFDPDCQPTPRPNGKCANRGDCEHAPGGLCPDMILWSRASQDDSSNITGSSVFDFEGDGKAEVVYADECFSRVYAGSDGTVLFSRYRSSCTWLENPVVADVDGDFRAELVVPSNTACGPVGVGIGCRMLSEEGVDSQFAGLRCQEGTDCVSGVCDQGFCRCQASADCCAEKDDAKCIDFGTLCTTPPVGTPGNGNTCRAPHPRGFQGIRVYEDAADRWVRSRQVWNQHAYAVTHVNDDLTIPKSSAWAKNWTQPLLNNFRQNVPGTSDPTVVGDVTSQLGPFACEGPNARLTATVCNRGAAPLGAGISVGFYVGATKVCSAKTTGPLALGACEAVSCVWQAPGETPTDVRVVPNDDHAIQECHDHNNEGLIAGVACAAVR